MPKEIKSSGHSSTTHHGFTFPKGKHFALSPLAMIPKLINRTLNGQNVLVTRRSSQDWAPPNNRASIPEADAMTATILEDRSLNSLRCKGPVDDIWPRLFPRINIGKKQPPFVTSLLFVMTLGAYWPYWLKKREQELRQHKHHNFTQPFKISWPILALIPICHYFYFYPLTRLMWETERQNCYERFHPWLAICLCTIPPLGMCYFQSALNRHWDMHKELD